MIEQGQGIYTQRMLSLPLLQDIHDLSTKTRLPSILLAKYNHNNSKYYHHILMRKKSGGLRPIDSPNAELKAIQKWILRNILSCLKPSPYAKGFILGKSIHDNAKPHYNKQYILSLDLNNFFGTVKASHVFSIFHSIGYSKKISYLLTSICTLDGVLPQGAPTSPYLSNLVCLRLDHRIGKYCDNKALTYTRYADDICISGNKLSVIKKAQVTIKNIIINEGYTVNKRKELLSGPKSSRQVTGLVVTPDIGIGREKYNHYRKTIFMEFKKNPAESEFMISGILSFVKSVDVKRHKKLYSYYKSLIIKNPSMC
jgi:retron-type reverse transcriptase